MRFLDDTGKTIEIADEKLKQLGDTFFANLNELVDECVNNEPLLIPWLRRHLDTVLAKVIKAESSLEESGTIPTESRV